MILPYGETRPKLGNAVFVAPDAWVIGNVTLEDHASVFFGAVLRGDILPISIGRGSNVQEHAMLHTSHNRTPTVVGEEVTIGHRAILHGAKIGDRCLVGMGGILLDESVVEEECMIAAGALVTSRQHIPRKSMVMGVPAQVVRSLTDEEISFLKVSAQLYIQTAQSYLAMKLDNR